MGDDNISKKPTLNSVNLFMLFGIAWFIPQIFIVFLPKENEPFLIVILFGFGILIGFTNKLDRWLIEKQNG